MATTVWLPPDKVAVTNVALPVPSSVLACGAPPSITKLTVPVGRSVFHDHIVCLEDGKKLTMLKRHLRTAYNMTPDQYRERWGLAQDYPMVAPDYARQRAALARQIGLGKRPRQTAMADGPGD